MWGRSFKFNPELAKANAKLAQIPVVKYVDPDTAALLRVPKEKKVSLSYTQELCKDWVQEGCYKSAGPDLYLKIEAQHEQCPEFAQVCAQHYDSMPVELASGVHVDPDS